MSLQDMGGIAWGRSITRGRRISRVGKHRTRGRCGSARQSASRDSTTAAAIVVVAVVDTVGKVVGKVAGKVAGVNAERKKEELDKKKWSYLKREKIKKWYII